MTLTQYTLPATDKQTNYILTLSQGRDWTSIVSTGTYETVMDVIANADPELEDKRFIARAEASAAIDALLKCRPLQVPSTAQVTHPDLTTLPLSRYALPRSDGSGFDFFEVVERKSGRRFINRLVGSPGDWRREWLSQRHQIFAARHIAEDPKAAAVAYAREHGRCAVCDAHLSDPESIARSMGPVCAKRF